MKRNFLFALVILTQLLGGCCDEVFNVSNSKVLQSLRKGKPWTVQSVFINNEDYTNAYKDMTLRFDPQTYTSTNGRALWAESGTWKFQTKTDPNLQARFTKLNTPSGEVDVDITRLTDTELELNFNLPDDGFKPGGRTEGGLLRPVKLKFTANQ